MAEIAEIVSASETVIRVGTAFSIFLGMAMWELWAPWRTSAARAQRWPGNLALAVGGAIVARIAAPLAPVGAAIAADANTWGLLNWVTLPMVVVGVCGFLALDLVIYGQHRVFHALPRLWPIHRVHHADTAFDVTTGVRFHPIEILVSMIIKTGAVFAIGPTVATVIVFEAVLNAASLFGHGNVRLPERLDRALRWLIVTPDMHRIHHSIDRAETDSNFGFFVPWWDRLFGTYRDQPAAGRDGVTIGLPEFRTNTERGIGRLLTQPFRPPS